MKNNKTPLYVVLFILLVGALSAYRYSQKPQQAPVIQQESSIVVTQTVGQTSAEQRVEAGTSALELLEETTDAQMTGEGEMAFVTTINGMMADENKRQFWAFYVNGNQAEVGAGSYALQDGDEIEWKLDTY